MCILSQSTTIARCTWKRDTGPVARTRGCLRIILTYNLRCYRGWSHLLSATLISSGWRATSRTRAVYDGTAHDRRSQETSILSLSMGVFWNSARQLWGKACASRIQRSRSARSDRHLSFCRYHGFCWPWIDASCQRRHVYGFWRLPRHWSNRGKLWPACTICCRHWHRNTLVSQEKPHLELFIQHDQYDRFQWPWVFQVRLSVHSFWAFCVSSPSAVQAAWWSFSSYDPIDRNSHRPLINLAPQHKCWHWCSSYKARSPWVSLFLPRIGLQTTPRTAN